MTFRQMWKDERLQYDDIKGQIRKLTLTDSSKIWTPDIFFSEEREAQLHEIIKPNTLLTIYADGSVLYSTRVTLVLLCPMDLTYFPMDRQTCQMKIAPCKSFSLSLSLAAVKTTCSDAFSITLIVLADLIAHHHSD